MEQPANSRLMDMLRRNVAVIIALGSLFGTVTVGYASYRLLQQEVAQIRQQEEESAQAVRQVRTALSNHLAQPWSHLDQQKWEMLMKRLENIETSIRERK